MGWEKRGKNLYYYCKQRQGDRIISVYMGKGEMAEAIAEINELCRLQKLYKKIKKTVESGNGNKTK